MMVILANPGARFTLSSVVRSDTENVSLISTAPSVSIVISMQCTVSFAVNTPNTPKFVLGPKRKSESPVSIKTKHKF